MATTEGQPTRTTTEHPDVPQDVEITEANESHENVASTESRLPTESVVAQSEKNSTEQPTTTEPQRKPIQSLILDTGPLIKNAVSISTIINSAEEIFTTPAIISEIRDAATRSRVETTLMPFLKIRTPSPASYDAVTAFSKKTGDHAVLSRQDLGILALAYEVHCERNGGSWGLREVPKGPLKRKSGDETPEEETGGVSVEADQDTANVSTEETTPQEPKALESPADSSEPTQPSEDISSQPTEQLSAEGIASEPTNEKSPDNGEPYTPASSSSKRKARRRLQSAKKDASTPMEETAAPKAEPGPEVSHGSTQPEVEQETSRLEGSTQGPILKESTASQTITEDFSTLSLSTTTPPSPPQTDDDDSDGDWITPSNLTTRQAEDSILDTNARTATPIQMDVATMTIDFAMQNVLLQMNLHLLSTNMQRIAHLTSKVLRCHACFNIVKQMDKQFCPRCGGNSLRRVSCSTNSRGEFTIHLAKNYQWNKRGDKYSIPKPIAGTANTKWSGIGGGKGGWGRDLILAEDQKEHMKQLEERERKSRASDLMDDDYLPGILTGDRSGRAGGRVKVGAGKNVNSKKRF